MRPDLRLLSEISTMGESCVARLARKRWNFANPEQWLLPTILRGLTQNRLAQPRVYVALIGGSMQSKAHSIRVPETKFDGIQCDRLIAVFKEAYLEAGFQFVKETKEGIVTTVVFHFSIQSTPERCLLLHPLHLFRLQREIKTV